MSSVSTQSKTIQKPSSSVTVPMSQSLTITPLELHEAFAEKTELAQKITAQAAASAAISLSNTSVSFSACSCAAVRIINVHDSPITFKVQASQDTFREFHVSPETGTMKPKSTVIVAVAYCNWNADSKERKSSKDLSQLTFQLCSWNPDKSAGSKSRLRFSLKFDTTPNQLAFNEHTLADSSFDISGSESLHHRRQSGGGGKQSQRKTMVSLATPKHEDCMRGWPPFEKEKHLRKSLAGGIDSDPALVQNSSTYTPLSATRVASVTRLQNNATTVASKVKSIFMQLGLFGFIIYAYIFSYPGMTGTPADVMALKTAVLPAFLLGVVAEKIRRRCL
jgi:hypothetical protein